MASAIEERIKRLESMLKPLQEELKRLRDQVAGLRQQQYTMPSGAAGGDQGGGGGVYYANYLNIAGGGNQMGVEVRRSWTGAIETTTGTVYNAGLDATTNTRRQFLGKNPDGTFTVIGQSCSPIP